MTAVTAVHYPLGDVDPSATHVAVEVDVSNAVHRPGMQTHPQADTFRGTSSVADFHRAAQRCLRVAEKDQCHPISGRKWNDLVLGLRFVELPGAADALLQSLQQATLFGHGEQRIAHDVHEENVREFELLRLRPDNSCHVDPADQSRVAPGGEACDDANAILICGVEFNSVEPGIRMKKPHQRPHIRRLTEEKNYATIRSFGADDVSGKDRLPIIFDAAKQSQPRIQTSGRTEEPFAWLLEPASQ